jgi:hypothetical protein
MMQKSTLMEFNIKKYNTQISQNQLLSSFISSSRDTNADKVIAYIHSYNINNSLSQNVNC